MTTITIPRQSIKTNEELFAVPKSDFELLLGLKKIKEFTPTVAQKIALEKAEKNFKRGKTLSYSELVKKLGFTN